MILSTLLLGSLLYVTLGQLITLEKHNTVFLKGQIDTQLAKSVNRDLLAVVDPKIVLFISSPGGSVVDGNRIIQLLDALTLSGKEISCIAQEAYSMAFIIFQACPTRYVLPNSIIMQHQMFVFNMDQLERIKSRMKLLNSLETTLNSRQAERLKLSLKEFTDRVMNDWWIYGEDIILENAADQLTYVVCDRNYARNCPLV